MGYRATTTFSASGRKEHGVQSAAQGVQQQLDQVHRLGVAHDAAVDKNSVAAEEAAHGTEG